MEETLPKAWNKIVEEADELLIDLINETAEKICGFKADTELVEHFLSKNKNALLVPATPPKPTSPPHREVGPRRPTSTVSGNYTGKSISYFSFRGSKHEVKSWKDLLIKLCEIINSAHRDEFDNTVNIVGRKRPYFSLTGNELRAPHKINNSRIYVETNLNANRIVKICFDMLATFGYTSSYLKIEVN